MIEHTTYPTMEQAARLLIANGQASESLLCRYFKIDRETAADVMKQMEGFGIVGPFEGGSVRDILISSMNEVKSKLNSHVKVQ